MIFHWILIILIVLIPLYLWAYGASRFEAEDGLLQGRFWAGIFSGWLSVGLTSLLAQSTQNLSPFLFFGGIIVVFFLLYIIVYIYTRFGSSVSSRFLRRIATIHLVSIFLLLCSILLVSYFVTGSLLFWAFLLPLFVAAFFEEATKHLTTLGLIGKNFRFSQKDITLFAFYVVLGFVFIENILYLRTYGFDVFTWIFRSTFTFSAHLLSAIICTFAWWRALSYPLASPRYLAYFFFGFFWASLVHMGFNYFVETNNFVLLFVYFIAGYIAFTQSLITRSLPQE